MLTLNDYVLWPCRNKSLQFGFMHVDKGGGLTWYKELLLLSLTEPRNLNINPRNCVGTVLSLNGYRRYFCVFHATLPGGAIKVHPPAELPKVSCSLSNLVGLLICFLIAAPAIIHRWISKRWIPGI